MHLGFSGQFRVQVSPFPNSNGPRINCISNSTEISGSGSQVLHRILLKRQDLTPHESRAFIIPRERAWEKAAAGGKLSVFFFFFLPETVKGVIAEEPFPIPIHSPGLRFFFVYKAPKFSHLARSLAAHKKLDKFLVGRTAEIEVSEVSPWASARINSSHT